MSDREPTPEMTMRQLKRYECGWCGQTLDQAKRGNCGALGLSEDEDRTCDSCHWYKRLNPVEGT